ncbi:acetylornithine transaminase [Myceligenerans salitolerans]|uniref:Acetylornithine transaminase n=1 Tax=Myceligenerans salitolerans TaxID=1230528 RepID=A0ABS3I585_9MICO|nr:acetylornithine transaminase [Myceligenerans salitolerans]MBO0608139.1 acetylornithine transaminase [Myceligenerans salitolerans]
MSDLTTAGAGSPPVTRGAVESGGLTGAAWTERYTGAVMDTFGPPQRVLVRGDGAYVWDADGKRYLDLLAGIAVNSLGHAHPTLTAAISAQLGTLGHTSNFFGTPAQISLAERLLALAGAPAGSRVFFTNSGTEALEAAFKMTRRVPVSSSAGTVVSGVPDGSGPVPGRGRSGGCRTRVLALEGGFHGRSMGALALTHKAAYREPFEPLPAGVEHLPFGDAAALEAAFAPDAVAERGEVAAFVAEPLQGEAGVRPLPPGYLALARRLTREHGALLVLDEVQTGVGRTGEWFAFQHPDILGPADAGPAGADVLPDVVTLAKGLGGGFPVGAVIAFGDEPARLLGRGQHGSTFGGNPVASAAGLATLGVIERDGLLAQVRETGELLRREIEGSGNPLISGVRGRGLLLAVQLSRPVAQTVVARALEAGFIVNAVAPDAVRLAPPLTLTADQAREAAAFFAALPSSPAEDIEEAS